MIIDALLRALSMAFAMSWEILWPLILGFALSAVVQAVVSHREMSRLLPDDRSRSVATALALGAASSSCSYAAVALARSLFRKGANFTAAMAFELASTNLVIELGIIMLVLLGWQLTLAEFIGAPIMVVLLVVIFRLFLSRQLHHEAKTQANRGVAGRMEGHAEMDMSVSEGGTLWQRITSAEGVTAISHYFVMDWASVWLDIVGGLLIAGALAAWVPHAFWQSARGRAVERRHQLRRRDRVHLCRPDRAPDPRHLSQVLRMEDVRLPVGQFLRRQGRRCPDRGSDFLDFRAYSVRTQRARRGSVH